MQASSICLKSSSLLQTSLTLVLSGLTATAAGAKESGNIINTLPENANNTHTAPDRNTRHHTVEATPAAITAPEASPKVSFSKPYPQAAAPAVELAQSVPDNAPNPDIFQEPVEPEELPEPTEAPEIPLEVPADETVTPESRPESLSPESLPDAIAITQFQITPYSTTTDSQPLTVFTPETLLNTLQIAPDPTAPSQSLADFNTANQNQPPINLAIRQLLQLPVQVATLYAERGYTTSGAIISIDAAKNLVNIQVIEGKVEAIQVERIGASESVTPETNPETIPSLPQCPTGAPLRCGYVESRLAARTNTPLNTADLQESLQLLQLDPLIDSISAVLSEGATPGSSRLLVQFREARPITANISFNNGRSPSIGTFQTQIGAQATNTLGIGDTLDLSYNNTEGSNGLNARYTVPFNRKNGTVSLRFNTAGSEIIEAPFDEVDIESSSQTYEAEIRQPIIRRINGETFEELAIGLTGSLRKSQSRLLGENFPLSLGADEQGRTNIFALRFFQEWTQQNSQQVLALRSQFNLGLGLLDATINDTVPGADPLPDSRFLSWQGQAQWIRRLGSDTFFTTRTNIQLATEPLLSAERFSLGGFGSVRGYRQDTLQTDSGLLVSAEVRQPILRLPDLGATLSVIPFVDVGLGWNVSGQAPDQNTLASTGLGMQWQQNRFSARLEYGLPLTPNNSRNRTWQENGFLFSTQYSF